jgi:peptide/nickel transport system permease protein
MSTIANAAPAPAEHSGAIAAVAAPKTRRFATLAASPLLIKLCLFVILAMVAIALLAPVLAPDDPAHQELRSRLGSPTGAHWLGNDQLGRDVFSRTLYGARISIGVAAFGTVAGAVLGSFFGMLAGYQRGRVDSAIMFLVDAQQALPFIIVALVAIAIFGASIPTLLALVSLAGWEVYARFARASTLVVRESQYVLASRCIGTSETRILLRHVLPNIVSPLIVIATLNITSLILLESSLSFLGVGVQPPTPSWGGMISEGRQYLNTAWWIVVGPAAAMVLLTLSISLAGDWLRDVLDPTSRRR